MDEKARSFHFSIPIFIHIAEQCFDVIHVMLPIMDYLLFCGSSKGCDFKLVLICLIACGKFTVFLIKSGIYDTLKGGFRAERPA